MNRREFIRANVVIAAAPFAIASAGGPRFEIWQGLRQRAGQFGDSQDDFNLLGHVGSEIPLASLTYSLNHGTARNLRFHVFRRIVAEGDFNADIPMAQLVPGENSVVIEAVDAHGNRAQARVIIRLETHGSCPLPVRIRWGSVKRLDDVGLCTDGKWTFGPQGLRTAEIGYDRVFLIGNRTWQDYEATAPVTIHALSAHNGPQSGTVRHAGFCMRWAGHSREDNAPDEQPKWGLHPRGGIVWLTVHDGKMPPLREFYPGDSDKHRSFEPFPIEFGRPFWMKGRCETLASRSAGMGVTRYSFKVWNTGEREPTGWDFQVVQESASALRRGGLALVAHETDTTFGDISIVQA